VGYHLMRWMAFAVAGVLLAGPALGQQTDQCATTPMPGNPSNIVIQKLTCRLQIEDNDRMQAEENLIVAQADRAIAEGKVQHLGDQVADLQKQVVTLKKNAADAKAALATKKSMFDRIKAALAALGDGK
jgi:hypothetical protein